MTRILTAVCGLIAFVIIGVGVAFPRLLSPAVDPPTEVAETTEQKNAEARVVFGTDEAEPPATNTDNATDAATAPTEPAVENSDQVVEGQIEDFLGQLGRRIENPRTTIGDAFDPAMMYGAIKQQVRIKLRSAEERELIRGLGSGLEKTRANLALIGWSDIDVRRIRTLDEDGDEVVAFARHLDDANLVVKMRWWLTRRDGAWRIYDYEDLSIGIRATSSMSLILAPAIRQGGLPPWITEVQAVVQAMPMLAGGDIHGAENVLLSANGDIPDLFAGLRSCAWAIVRLGQNRPMEALDHLDGAARLNPDMPILSYLRAMAFNRQGLHDDALAAAQEYLDTLGDDADGYAQLAIAQRGLGATADATASCLRGLADVPGHEELIALLAATSTEDGMFDEAYARIPNPRVAFETIAEIIVTDADEDALARVIETHRAIDPDDVLLDYYAAILDNWEGHPEHASERIDQHLDTLVGDSLIWFTVVYLNAMIDQDRAIEGYRRVERSRDFAYPYVSDQIAAAEDWDALELLLDLRRIEAPSDPNVAVFEAELAFANAEWARAADVLLRNQKQIMAETDQLWRYENRLIRSLAQLERWDQALVTARSSTRRDGDPFFEAYLQILRGNADEAAHLVDRCLRLGTYSIADFYDDPELAHHLEEPAFSSFRSQFPRESAVTVVH